MPFSYQVGAGETDYQAGLAIGTSNSLINDLLSDGKLAGKVAGEVLEGPMSGLSGTLKYQELRAQGFSHEASLAGASVGVATGQLITRGGAAIGGLAGIPGSPVGSVIGAAAGGTVAGVADWWYGFSDDAAYQAAVAIDGKSK